MLSPFFLNLKQTLVFNKTLQLTKQNEIDISRRHFGNVPLVIMTCKKELTFLPVEITPQNFSMLPLALLTTSIQLIWQNQLLSHCRKGMTCCCDANPKKWNFSLKMFAYKVERIEETFGERRTLLVRIEWRFIYRQCVDIMRMWREQLIKKKINYNFDYYIHNVHLISAFLRSFIAIFDLNVLKWRVKVITMHL